MQSIDDIRSEIAGLGVPNALDLVRRKYLKALANVTGRPIVVFGVDFLGINSMKIQAAGQLLQISLADKDGFDEVIRDIQGEVIDIVIHSPGGSAEATESIVELLRARFNDIRFIVPSVAKSAATMLAMSGNAILMDELSELGPTDPQMVFFRDGRVVISPAQAIKDQFAIAQEQLRNDPALLPSWLPILREYSPSLLSQCDYHLELARNLVKDWLRQYMFLGDPDADAKADRIATFLADHGNFGSHSRRIGIDRLQQLGVNVIDMRHDDVLRSAVRDVYHALLLTFENSDAVRLFENHLGHALVTNIGITISSGDQQPNQQPQEPQLPPPSNRQQRRAQERGQRR